MTQRSPYLVNRAFRSYLAATVMSTMAVSFGTMLGSIVVGNVMGPTALGAVNVMMPIIQLLAALNALINIGGATVMAVNVGRGRTEEVRGIFTKSLLMSLAVSVAIAVLGVLFIDEVHTLDIECFSFLNRALESTLAPIVIFATNRGRTRIVGTDVEAAHGIPIDLQDRLLIIRTSTYKLEEMRRIIEIRAEIEKIGLPKEDADRAAVLDKLASIAAEKSLRYALQLLTPAKILAEADQLKEITVDNVEEAAELFIDIKASTRMIRDAKGKGYLL